MRHDTLGTNFNVFDFETAINIFIWVKSSKAFYQRNKNFDWFLCVTLICCFYQNYRTIVDNEYIKTR